VCHHLCNLKEKDFKVGHGQLGADTYRLFYLLKDQSHTYEYLGKATWLGYEGDQGCKTINVADKPVQYGLSLHPPFGGYSFVEYELGRVYECLNVTVALNDDVTVLISFIILITYLTHSLTFLLEHGRCMCTF
jgi:hypothetical protein